MIIYILWGILFTFIFDMILKGGEHEFTTLERIFFVVLWPIVLVWFLYFFIKNNWK